MVFFKYYFRISIFLLMCLKFLCFHCIHVAREGLGVKTVALRYVVLPVEYLRYCSPDSIPYVQLCEIFAYFF